MLQDEPLPPYAIAVRDATDADMGAVRDIYAHHVLSGLATFEELAPSLEDMMARRAAVRAAGLPWLAAQIDGAVAGYAYATGYRARPAYRYTLENSVYVDAGRARRGIGGALLSALIARCEAGPWRQMIAIIGDTANVASIRLHERHGFTYVGTLTAVGFKHGRWVDSVLLQRLLGDGGATLPGRDGTRSR